MFLKINEIPNNSSSNSDEATMRRETVFSSLYIELSFNSAAHIAES